MSMLKAPLLAFYSKDFYKNVANNEKGMGFFYLFCIVSISWLISIASFYFLLSEQLNNPMLNSFIDKLPRMTVKNSKLSIDKTSPYTFNFADKEIIFDTSGKYKNLDDTQGAILLVTENSIFMDSASRPINWSDFNTDFDLTSKDIKPNLKNIINLVCLIGIPLGLVVYIGHLILSLIYGAIGMLIGGNSLGYATCVRISTIAMTPSIILSTILMLFHTQIPLWGILSIPLSLIYLYIGLKASLVTNSSQQIEN